MNNFYQKNLDYELIINTLDKMVSINLIVHCP